MSTLESRAKAAFSGMIRDGARICLLSRGLELLSAFAFKCAVVSDYARGDREGFFSAFDRYRFKESLQIPTGISMWVAALHDPIGHRGVDNHYWSSPRQEAFRYLRFYTHTFAAGHLVVQLHATRWTAFHKYGIDFPRVEPTTQWDERAVTQFWPNNYGFPIEWPPPLYLSSDVFQQFIDRWSGNVNIQA